MQSNKLEVLFKNVKLMKILVFFLFGEVKSLDINQMTEIVQILIVNVYIFGMGILN